MNRLTARGAGIIMISSELPELLGMSDRILVMHRGPHSGRARRRGGAREERVLERGAGTRTALSDATLRRSRGDRGTQFGTLIGLLRAVRDVCGS